MKKSFLIVLAIMACVGVGFVDSVLADFPDVLSDHSNYDAINYVQSNNVIQGYNDGTYRPDIEINRAEFTKIVIGSVMDESQIRGSNCFPDVRSEWFAEYVCTAQAQGLIAGYPDGTFRPTQYISFVEAAKIISNANNFLSESSAVWYENFVRNLAEKNAIPVSINQFGKTISRGEMAEMIYRIKADVTSKVSRSYEDLDTNAVIASSSGKGMVDTGQSLCFDDKSEKTCPSIGEAYYGQDAQYSSNPPSYTDNGNGTVTDNVTGLTWSQATDSNKVSLVEAEAIAAKMTLGGHSDWRVPDIKEMYSLIDFDGYTGFGGSNDKSSVPDNFVPFIDTDYFEFKTGDSSAGERYIDAQWLTTSKYVSTTMNGSLTLFGVNFADGRIKGYGYSNPSRPSHEKKFYARYVRGNTDYSKNDFVDNGNETITDRATDLVWMKSDSQTSMDWPSSLDYCENLGHAGTTDWRLPNAKELQYIVDYTRSPATTSSAAIDPIFDTTSIIDEKGETNYPFFWTSTTHLDGPHPGTHAAYVAFGEALGSMPNDNSDTVIDVHGAGAQRSDPKTGSPDDVQISAPQEDVWRIDNHVRCVRNGASAMTNTESGSETDRFGTSDIQIPSGGGGSTMEQSGAPSGNSGASNGGGPPAEAISACSGKSSGTSCSMSTPQGSLSGQCLNTPDGAFACVPK
jgi:hypothetical protein